jgi:hypothetical protein
MCTPHILLHIDRLDTLNPAKSALIVLRHVLATFGTDVRLGQSGGRGVSFNPRRKAV